MMKEDQSTRHERDGKGRVVQPKVRLSKPKIRWPLLSVATTTLALTTALLGTMLHVAGKRNAEFSAIIDRQVEHIQQTSAQKSTPVEEFKQPEPEKPCETKKPSEQCDVFTENAGKKPEELFSNGKSE